MKRISLKEATRVASEVLREVQSREAHKEVAKFERAIAKYGVEACRKAHAANEEGWGPSSILLQVPCGYNFTTVGQVDAAINAGRWAKSIGLKGEKA